ncbi:MAG: long-chain fatty acid--CoA ligase [Armatimonadota bacterium]|nr:long-chain fatty acid--CoA ligase [Armatimonadota bacterium]MDR7485121.1 long-chain fatty acid--CoA ligase [Armatimonadota bacterium]MDR7533509.1 long-chain fatty acid--CoA ligase [Armatimonadota bacterium]MDR7536990.1 long-chain fatty acid--CoA ligase [Armatimonadota bacterium]
MAQHEGTAPAHRWYRWYEPGVPRVIDVPGHPLHGFLDASARRFPRHVALMQAGPRFDRRLTYADLDALTDRFARALLDRGLQAGDRVAVMLPNCPQYVIAAFGVWKAGGTLVQVNPLYKGRDLAFVLQDAGARFAVGLSRLYAQLHEVRPHTPLEAVILTNLHDFFPLRWRLLYGALRAKKEGDVIPAAAGVVSFARALRAPRLQHRPVVGADDVAVLQYTGGTTGIPKAAMLTHRNLVANTLQARAWLSDLREGGERILAVVPFFHVFGLTVCMNVAVAIAATSIVLLMRMFEVKTVVEAVARYRPTIFPGVPAMYVAINQMRDVEKYDLKSIRACVSGAAPLPVEVQRRFEALTGGRIAEGYGLSEASPLTHANPIHGTRKVGSIGLPVPSTEAKIVDVETGTRDLPPGEVGELVIRGPQVMKGYWRNPEETAGVLRHGWLYTGDIARMDEDGFFFIEDRKKDMVNIGGFKVFPREVEEVLYAHPRVKEAAVVGVRHRIRGEMLVAHVVPRDAVDARAFVRELHDHCSRHLSAYKVPRRFEIVAEIPKTLVGKALRRTIREQEEARPAAGQEE